MVELAGLLMLGKAVVNDLNRRGRHRDANLFCEEWCSGCYNLLVAEASEVEAVSRELVRTILRYASRQMVSE